MPKFRVGRHEVTQPLDQPFRLIPLTQGQNAIVDVEDFAWLSQFNWCAAWHPSIQSFYAVRTRESKSLYMHRFIVGEPVGKETDHWNHNGIDNRRKNLRVCGHLENTRNLRHWKNVLKGTTWREATQKWEASIKIQGRSIYLGSYPLRRDAAIAYDIAAKKYFGEFAFVNFQSHVIP